VTKMRHATATATRAVAAHTLPRRGEARLPDAHASDERLLSIRQILMAAAEAGQRAKSLLEF
jgi:hypothetical protein